MATHQMHFLGDNCSSFLPLEAPLARSSAQNRNEVDQGAMLVAGTGRSGWASTEPCTNYGCSFAKLNSAGGCFARFNGEETSEGADNLGVKRPVMSLEEEAAARLSWCSSVRMCQLCGTAKTPLWRSGPQGPKSLCNACGIRYKKSQRAAAAAALVAELDLHEATESVTSSSLKKQKKLAVARRKPCVADGMEEHSHQQHILGDDEVANDAGTHPCSKKRFRVPAAAIEEDQHPAPPFEPGMKRSSADFELEQAAFLLMALSCGLVLA